MTEVKHKSKKAKVINKSVVEDELKYENYTNVLFNRLCMQHEINRIQRRYHRTTSYRINKISLSSYNHKKCILQDGYIRLSHFNKSTR